MRQTSSVECQFEEKCQNVVVVDRTVSQSNRAAAFCWTTEAAETWFKHQMSPTARLLREHITDWSEDVHTNNTPDSGCFILWGMFFWVRVFLQYQWSSDRCLNIHRFTANSWSCYVLKFWIFFFLGFLWLFLCFKTSLQQLQLFSRMRQLCFTVKLQNCSVDDNTCHIEPSSLRGRFCTWTHSSAVFLSAGLSGGGAAAAD